MSAGSEATTQLDTGTDAHTSTDELFETLKNARRRTVLYYLLNEEEETVRFRDLVEYVAASENETDPEAVTAAQRNRVRTALYQHHLDKLEEHGFITYDKREGTITLNGDSERIRPFIEGDNSQRTDTINYGLGGAMIAIAALMLWAPGLYGFGALAVAGLGMLQIAHTYQSGRKTDENGRETLASVIDRLPKR